MKLSTINSFTLKKSCDHDEIPIKFIKISTLIIAQYLSSRITFSFQMGIFPDSLKIARVVQVFKKGNNCNVNKYRPISILTSFFKIFEKAFFCSY